VSSAQRPLLQVEGLSKHFAVRSTGLLRRRIGVVKACDDVSFHLQRGQTLALVGESGSGKSTLARTLLGVTRPSGGRAIFSDPDPLDLASASAAQMRAVRPRLQMIFQDPFSSLNPRMTIEQIIAEPLRVCRVASGRELEDRVVQMLRRVGIRPEYRKRYPHAFSGGQRQRVGIARALILQPSLVVADEPVSALDVSVQAQIINLLMELQEELGLSYLFITHDLALVPVVADRVAVMQGGRIVEQGTPSELFEHPQHDYTRLLIDSMLSHDPDEQQLQ